MFHIILDNKYNHVSTSFTYVRYSLGPDPRGKHPGPADNKILFF